MLSSVACATPSLKSEWGNPSSLFIRGNGSGELRLDDDGGSGSVDGGDDGGGNADIGGECWRRWNFPSSSPSPFHHRGKKQRAKANRATVYLHHQPPITPPPLRHVERTMEEEGEEERERGGGERRRGEARKGMERRRSLRPPRPAHRNLCQWMLLLPRLAGLIRRGRAENAKNSY